MINTVSVASCASNTSPEYITEYGFLILIAVIFAVFIYALLPKRDPEMHQIVKEWKECQKQASKKK